MQNGAQTLYTNNPVPNIDKTEDKKVSFWLKKLYALRKDKAYVEDNGNVDKTFEEKGRDQQTKDKTTKEEVDKQKVFDLIKKSNRPIIEIKSIFPWDFFPTTITVEESRVTFLFRQFISSQSHSVDIKDISNVFIETSLFFATLRIVSRTYFQNDIKISFLNKKKAIRVRMILEGLRIFLNNNIDTSNYKISELIAKTEEFHKNNSE